MIIATKDINFDKVIKLVNNEDDLCSYIKSLVPEKYSHCDAIYHNTRYYINLEILKDNSIALDTKNKLSNMLTRNIRVVGYMGVYITCSELEQRVDMNKVNKYYEGDLYGKSF